MKRILTLILSIVALSAYAAETLDSKSFHTLNGNTLNSNAIFEGGAGTVAFLGGSITYNAGWRDHTMEYFKESYPNTKFNFINGGMPSVGSIGDAFRAERDIYSKGIPDLLFVDAAVNDRSHGVSDVLQKRAVEGIIRKALDKNPKMDIVFLYFADPMKLEDYKAGRVPKEIAIQQSIVDYYKLSSVNIAKEIYSRIENGEFSWKEDIKDLHPSPFGQDIYAASIKSALETLRAVEVEEKKKYKMPKQLDKYSFVEGRLVDPKEAEMAPMFTYHPNYSIPEDGAKRREGFDNVPMLVGEKAGDVFVYKFKGSAIGIALASGPDAGMVECFINGGEPKIFDLFSKWSSNLHYPNFLMFNSDLSSGVNYISIRIMQPKNSRSSGNKCRVVHLLVNSD